MWLQAPSARAAFEPFIPCTPAPGGVDAEHMKTPGTRSPLVRVQPKACTEMILSFASRIVAQVSKEPAEKFETLQTRTSSGGAYDKIGGCPTRPAQISPSTPWAQPVRDRDPRRLHVLGVTPPGAGVHGMNGSTSACGLGRALAPAKETLHAVDEPKRPRRHAPDSPQQERDGFEKYASPFDATQDLSAHAQRSGGET